jgi:hypothetical protein
MLRSILSLTLGVFSTAVLIAAISVYLFHDVDHDQIGRWNQAFSASCFESVLFTLIICGATALLTSLGRYLFHLRDHSPGTALGLFLGIGITVLQYPWDFIARRVFPRFADFSLFVYLVVAIVVCTGGLLRESFRQRKSRKAAAASSPV